MGVSGGGKGTTLCVEDGIQQVDGQAPAERRKVQIVAGADGKVEFGLEGV